MELKVPENLMEVAERNLWLLKNVKNRLESSNWPIYSKVGTPIVIATRDYPYQYDSVELVKRMLSHHGWKLSLSKYDRKQGSCNKDMWCYYTFWMEKEK